MCCSPGLAISLTVCRRSPVRLARSAGLKPGRTSKDQLVVCSNIGMAVCDVVVAREVFDRALAQNLGRKLPL